jgi:hypothetical protein
VLTENAAMLTVFRRSGLRLESRVDSGTLEVKMHLD